MTPEPRPPAPKHLTWRRVIEQSWQGVAGADPSHPDGETLAAYADGNLPEALADACMEHLSRCPQCLDLVRELSADMAGRPAAAQPQRTRQQRSWSLRGLSLLAASLLAAVVGLGWGLSQSRHMHDLRQQLGQRDAEVADATLQLASVQKERFLEQAASGVRGYWSGTTSPQTLLLPAVRGAGELGPQARAHAERAAQALEELSRMPAYRGRALLELAALDIGRRDMTQAEAHWQEARAILGDAPDVINLRAVWCLAGGDPARRAEAEKLWRSLTRQAPDFLPAWYNLALLLQQSGRDEESRTLWREYLARESRPDYRRAAEEHVLALRP